MIQLLIHAPRTFWTVGLVQFFCWAAFLYMWTYTPGAIADTVWDTTDTDSQAYQTAGNWVGVLFAVQAVGSVLWAIVIPRFRSHKTVYALSLLLGAVGFISTLFVRDQYVLFISFLLIGCAWAAMLALPFTILTNSISGKNMGTSRPVQRHDLCAADMRRGFGRSDPPFARRSAGQHACVGWSPSDCRRAERRSCQGNICRAGILTEVGHP